ncbi:hypothetical protein DFP72DRAFT_1067401 [Ephemerocybe angulata]|uniref:Uncharacterized protein n=1 Tax=Ephemerocybe angulata TaxID=980116 RepID=A0A8H6HYK1_9AGAR|nr:hypothetical protein DFP72DRAFT_1067401 [Tulosesus angulatus]
MAVGLNERLLRRRSAYITGSRSFRVNQTHKIDECSLRRRYSLRPCPYEIPSPILSAEISKSVSIPSLPRSNERRRFSFQQSSGHFSLKSNDRRRYLRRHSRRMSTDNDRILSYGANLVSNDRRRFSAAEATLMTTSARTPHDSYESAGEDGSLHVSFVDPWNSSQAKGSAFGANLPPRFAKLATAAHPVVKSSDSGQPSSSTQAFPPILRGSDIAPLSAEVACRTKSRPPPSLKFLRYEEENAGGIGTVWYESSSNCPIVSPSLRASPGELYVHFHHAGHQVWVQGAGWEKATEGCAHPLNDRSTLHIRSSGEPIWYTRPSKG